MKDVLGTTLTVDDLRAVYDRLDVRPPDHCIHFWEAMSGKTATVWLRENFPGCIKPCDHVEMSWEDYRKALEG